MIINKEEVEEAAKENCEYNQDSLRQYDKYFIGAFKDGVEFAEEYAQKHIQDIITENQGLKLYKDNEAARFKKFSVEFGEWILQNDDPGFKLVFGDGLPNRWGSVRQGGGYNTTEELYELFLKERNEKI